MYIVINHICNKCFVNKTNYSKELHGMNSIKNCKCPYFMYGHDECENIDQDQKC